MPRLRRFQPGDGAGPRVASEGKLHRCPNDRAAAEEGAAPTTLRLLFGRFRRIITVVQVILVRHARAGSKRRWSGLDECRPLDEVGAQHAVGLVDTLAVTPIRRLVSSPALRCVQTLEPLARHTGLTIELSGLLAADGNARAMLAQPEDVLANAVLCTHGEVMRPLLRHIRRRDVAIIGDPGRRGSLLSKGVAWQLDIADNGTITKLQAFPPTA